MKKILVIDDHPAMAEKIAEKIEDFLAPEKLEIEEYHDFVGARKGIEQSGGDYYMAVIDNLLPGRKRGHELAATLRHTSPSVNIVYYTAFDNSFLLYQLMMTQPLGIVLKNEDKATQNEAFRLLAHGKAWNSQDVEDLINEPAWKKISKLDEEDIALLKMVADNYTNKEIYQQLKRDFPETSCNSVRTVTNRVSKFYTFFESEIETQDNNAKRRELGQILERYGIFG